MLSWLTGSRASHDGEILGEATFLDVPETPAHLFAVKAFKQALFGTPQPVTPFIPKANGAKFHSHLNKSGRADEQKTLSKAVPKPKPVLNRLSALRNESEKTSSPAESPTKPQGILLTPGTAAGRRKQVKFGEKVVDNEGKRKNYSLSGLPDEYPGKFPSPWTPKVTASDHSGDSKSERRLETRLKEVVESKKASALITSMPHSNTIPPTRSKDDNDITTDLTTPISAAGRYWKSQYDTYSMRSEAELTRLIAKHRLAKDYARMKDEEVTSLKAQLEIDRRKKQERERSLEKQVKDLRERLRLAMAENAKMAAELSALRNSPGEGKRLPTATSEIDDGILKELVDAGFKDIEIPAGRRESGSHKSLEDWKPITESSGQDIWLDNNLEDDTFHSVARNRLVKSTPAPKLPRGKSTPLSSKSIREKLTNPLALKSANIISKPPSSSVEKQLLEEINMDQNKISTDIDATPIRTPRSGSKAAGTSISGRRKEGALARIEERRKSRLQAKPEARK